MLALEKFSTFGFIGWLIYFITAAVTWDLNLPLVKADDYTLEQDVQSGPINLLSLYLEDSEVFNRVVDHGCWCNKLDAYSPYTDIHGGPFGIDELDNICREWFLMRACSINYYGGECYGKNITYFEYSIFINEDTDPRSMTCHISAPDTGIQHNDCEFESCVIDKYFVRRIGDYVRERNNTFVSEKVTLDGICSIPFKIKLVLHECAGNAPNLQIKPLEPVPDLVSSALVDNVGKILELDIVLMMDGTTELDDLEFYTVSEFLKQLVDPFAYDVNRTRVSIMQYAEEQVFYLTMSEDQEDIDQAFLDMLASRLDQEERDIARALHAATIHLDENKRDGNVGQIVVIVTAGPSSHGLELINFQTHNTTFLENYNLGVNNTVFTDENFNGTVTVINTATELDNRGVTVYAIAVGSEQDYDELAEIANDPLNDEDQQISQDQDLDTEAEQDSENVFQVNEADEVASAITSIQDDIVADVLLSFPDIVSLVSLKVVFDNNCTCPDGTPKDPAFCSSDGAHECKNCDQGFIFGSFYDNQHQQCVPAPCTCENGIAATGADCPDIPIAKCEEDSCEDGFHYNEDTGLCERNVCVCPDGRPHTSAAGQPDCFLHESEHCFECNDYFHLEEDLDTILMSYDNSTGLTTCEENKCDCANGIGEIAPFCLVHPCPDCTTCVACDDVFHLVDDWFGFWVKYFEFFLVEKQKDKN